MTASSTAMRLPWWTMASSCTASRAPAAAAGDCDSRRSWAARSIFSAPAAA